MLAEDPSGDKLHSKRVAGLTMSWGVCRKRQSANGMCVVQLACQIHHTPNFFLWASLKSRKLKDEKHAA